MLTSIPSPGSQWQQFALGPVVIQMYALFIVTAMFVALVWSSKRLTKRQAEPGVMLDVAVMAILFGILGARVYHVLTHTEDYFYEGADLWAVVRIWEGGIAIFGALLAGAGGVFLAARWKKLRFFTLADVLAPTLLAAQAIGRLGNYFNQELFGLPTDLPWGLRIDAPNAALPVGLPEDVLFHPLFLYEMIWNLLGVAVLLFLEKKFYLQWGRLFALYLVWYGVGRSYLETLRIDPTQIEFLRVPTNAFTAMFAVCLGIGLFMYQSRKHLGLEASPYTVEGVWVPSASATIDVESANGPQEVNNERVHEEKTQQQEVVSEEENSEITKD